MATTDDEKNDLRKFFGWLLFLVLSALAVIGAFLVFDASDDGAPDLVPTTTAAPGPADDVDLAAVRAALADAGVVDPTVEVSGPRSIAVGGEISDDALRRLASDAARGALPEGVNLFSSFELVEAEPEAEAAEPEAEEVAEPETSDSEGFGTIDDLALDLGMSPDDYGIDPDGTLVVRRGVWDSSVFEEFFGVDVIDYNASQRRDAALAILQNAGVQDASVSFAATQPLRLRLGGVLPDGVDAASLIAEVEALALVDGAEDGFSVAADPAIILNSARGNVTVSGTAADDAQRQLIIDGVGGIFGAGNVIDDLQVGEVSGSALRLEGNVPDSRRLVIEQGVAELASSLGLELQDDFAYTALTDEQAALQESLAEIAAGIQINFASGSAALPADAPAQLDALVEALLEAPEGTLIAVEGHTDDQGDAASNRLLSQERAQSVVAYLVQSAVPSEFLRAVGQGESLPIADNATADGRAQNRRIEFNVVV